MFSIGFLEIILIVIVGVIFLKPTDMVYLYKKFTEITVKLNSYCNKLKDELIENGQTDSLTNEIDSLKNEIGDIIKIDGKNYIRGDDGNFYETYIK